MSLSDTDILDRDLLQRGVPHELYRRIRAEQPVYRQELPGGRGYWALSRHADVMHVSRDPQTFSAQAKGMLVEDLDHLLPTLLSLDPPWHTEIRRPLIGAFSPAMARALEPRMRALLGDVFERAAASGECDFVRDVVAPLPLAIICDVLGIPEPDRAEIGFEADVLAGMDDPDYRVELAGRGPTEAALALGGYALRLGERLKQTRTEPGDDVVSLLMRSTKDGEPIDLGTFSGLFTQILIGGNETTRTLICGGVVELVARPDVWRELTADPALIPGAVEEMLRFVTPVHYFRRTAMRDVELRGTKIRSGDRVVFLYASANRDEEVFEAPDRFDIRRDPNPHVAFGFGEHFCLGARLARLEARVFFEELLRRFERVELLGAPQRMRSNQLNAIKRMPVRLVLRRGR